MLRSANVFPSEVILKSKFFFIGRILELLEVRRPVPLRESRLLSHSIPSIS